MLLISELPKLITLPELSALSGNNLNYSHGGSLYYTNYPPTRIIYSSFHYIKLTSYDRISGPWQNNEATIVLQTHWIYTTLYKQIYRRNATSITEFNNFTRVTFPKYQNNFSTKKDLTTRYLLKNADMPLAIPQYYSVKKKSPLTHQKQLRVVGHCLPQRKPQWSLTEWRGRGNPGPGVTGEQPLRYKWSRWPWTHPQGQQSHRLSRACSIGQCWRFPPVDGMESTKYIHNSIIPIKLNTIYYSTDQT